LHEKASGTSLRATHTYSAYQIFHGEIKLDDK